MLCRLLLPALVSASSGFTNSVNPLPGYLFEWTADQVGKVLNVQITLTPPAPKTVGWVGFGIAGGAGGMLGGDMFTAYSTGATTCEIQDRQAGPSVKQLPDMDTSYSDGFSDWELDSCSLNGGVLTVAAHRPFQTFDAHDQDFVTGPMELLFVYGQTQPTSPDTITFHDGGYMPLAVSLWGEAVPSFNKSALESDYDTQSLMMPVGTPIGYQTSYTCMGVNLTQKLGAATQAIAFEPIITPGHEAYVHHMVLYTCNSPITAVPFNCINGMPSACQSILYAWGKGGNPFVLPSVTGIEVGSPNRTYAVLQMHYNNPNNAVLANDTSGISIYRTNQIRKYYSGMFVFGTTAIALPPGKASFTVSADCPPAATSLLPAGGVTTYASFLHAHQRGRRIWSNLKRGNTIINTIGENQNYDFNLQKIQLLSPPVQLEQLDDVITYCTYDMSNDTTTVSFGETTSNEMCFNFVAYYPILGTQPTYFCNVPQFANTNPGPQSCSMLPGQPPAAYTVSGLVPTDVTFFSGGTASCAPGFHGQAVLGCAGYGAPFSFTGCVRGGSLTGSAMRPVASVGAVLSLFFLL